MAFKTRGIAGEKNLVTKRKLAYKGNREAGRERRGKPRECGVWKPREECVSIRKAVNCTDGWSKKEKHLLTLATGRSFETLMRSFKGMVGKEFLLK